MESFEVTMRPLLPALFPATTIFGVRPSEVHAFDNLGDDVLGIMYLLIT
jgi:hypothetical protein